jgi:hypothetical protein
VLARVAALYADNCGLTPVDDQVTKVNV